MIKLSILHNDGKIADIEHFLEEDLDDFLNCIYKNKMYWNTLTGRGFWVNPLTIRHIIAERLEEQYPKPPEPIHQEENAKQDLAKETEPAVKEG